ncbi:hypothetical protein [Yinghuangia soli]|uniref:NACHT domain-containing protein n=1 Tax=Yinghuangia soli TaxID=2908204 RepID=A0AA41PU67_9ACTN|nr:hypothetical protein [Yinghuangia soli]MCF2525652.1 hypothetical protein [Yinghuangia soli]
MLVLAAGAALLLPDSTKGDVDPAGILVGSAGLVAAIGALWFAWVTLRHADADPEATAVRLAGQVLAAETRARAHLLGGDAAVIDVRFVFHAETGHNAEGALPDGTLGAVAAYYRALRPGRLVITGAPGAGKTVAAIELMLALLDRRVAGEPVPVRMSLASWSEITAGETGAKDPELFTAWLTRTLIDTYRLRPAAAAALVSAGLVLPVLDGLDEMDAADNGSSAYHSRARRALEVLNAYQLGAGRAPLVLTCRSAPYRHLQAVDVWARDAARVEITDVTPAQARDFIRRSAANPQRWQAVLDHLDTAPSGPLARGLATPWRLTIAVAAHEQRDRRTGAYANSPRDLLAPGLDTDGKVRSHLIRLLVATTAADRSPPGGADARRVRTWLGTLAVYLNTNTATPRVIAGRTLSGTDLVPHELWPIPGRVRARVVHGIVCLAAGAAALTGAVGLIKLAGDATINPLSMLWSAVVLPGVLVGPSLAWPTPERIDPDRLRTAHGRRTLVRGLGMGAVIGATVMGYFGVAESPGVGFLFAVPLGVATGLTFGFASERMFTPADEALEVAEPGGVIRGDTVFGLFFSAAFGAAFVAATVGLGWLKGAGSFAIHVGAAVGLMGAGVIGCVLARVSLRYLALLICTRRTTPLPWRLGRFLAWGEHVGLLRIAGNAYQFRHRELQDWLADPANRL